MNMYQYESDLIKQGVKLIAGVDEAGRGPLCGPVVVAAVILPLNCNIIGVNDSKKLTEKKRELAFKKIIEVALDYHILFIDSKTIDKFNIYQATKLGMQEILKKLSLKPEHALIDAMKLDTDMATTSIIKGDSLSLSIAAASILAKVARDKYMNCLDEMYPEYGFSKHKGYGTKLHLEALNKYGAIDEHRRSYKPVMNVLEKIIK